MFIGLAIVCDDYFVPALDRIADGKWTTHLLKAYWGLPGASWGLPGGFLGASWCLPIGFLGLSGEFLGASWCFLGASWGLSGGFLEASLGLTEGFLICIVIYLNIDFQFSIYPLMWLEQLSWRRALQGQSLPQQ